MTFGVLMERKTLQRHILEIMETGLLGISISLSGFLISRPMGPPLDSLSIFGMNLISVTFGLEDKPNIFRCGVELTHV